MISPTHQSLSSPLQDSKKFAIGILVVFLVYEFAGALLFKVDPATVPVWDTSGYVTALLQYENPTALPKDTIFSNHKFSDSIWSSSALYMYGLELLHQATQHNIARAFSLLRVLILLLYLPLMYFLLLQITKNPLIAAMLSIVSSYPAAFLATDRFWGIAIDFSKLVPETLYMPFSVLLGLLAYQYWFAPGAKNRRIVPWHILAIGILAGTGVFLVHAITSIAAIELLILFGFLQSLRRKIPLWSVILFGVVTIPALVVRLFSCSCVPAQPSSADANVILDIGQFWMIFPWTGRWSLTTLTPNSAMLAPFLAC